jgi:hypothetical protein
MVAFLLFSPRRFWFSPQRFYFFEPWQAPTSCVIRGLCTSAGAAVRGRLEAGA